MIAPADAIFMERALLLGERGRGRTTPNPNVGAVIVSPEGIVVGQGTTKPAGGPHAEIVALARAGGAAAGATLYCTLEPCSHTGRTGPCVARIVAAGIRRVVAAIADPNPRVRGAGFEYLRAHGVDVSIGPGADEATREHAPFATWVTAHRPFVIAKVAVSADGFVGRTDRRIGLTSREADRYLQRQRAALDAIAVGAGTVLVDDPVLTAREAYRSRPLTRVIVDWRGRVPETARVFATLDAGPVIMVVSTRTVASRPDHFRRLSSAGVTVEPFDTVDLGTVLGRLAARDVVSLLVEGGPRLHRALWQAGLVDRVQVVRTPVVLDHGVPNGLPDLPASRSRRLGPDLLVETDVHGTD
ncbi:MAG: bifunctional diaminohydroxyphosphoribosylaminopyrimidine deaminase/5-amino-6-(5-phosphoribosylamino)uracil reductase RibD [Acidobacteria bacterium]|nr:bifunctional diaminohydroxyphosphoribosylaminopyrimidine deaminase/5-amino-6-(5-phosphoribosylamino)uracil reductase RibD [Acidobacteriota bacterium]